MPVAARRQVGSTCAGEGCPDLPDCSGAKEQFPESCSQQTRQCHGTTVKSDKAVCDSCYDMLDRLNIGSPIAPCACTYCALQLSACFESAKARARRRRFVSRPALSGDRRVRLGGWLRRQRLLLRHWCRPGHVPQKRQCGSRRRTLRRRD